MSSGSFLELSQRAARAARFDPSDTTDLTRAKEAVNEAYLTSCAGGIQYDFLEQEGQWTCTSGSDVYSYDDIGTAMNVTGTIQEIVSMVDDTNGNSLTGMDWESLERLSFSSQDGDSNSQPLWFSKWRSQIRLYPTPDQAYKFGVLVRVAPSEMSADGDVPLVPLAYRHRLIVSQAAANLLRQEGGAEAHQEATYYQRVADDAQTAMRTAHATARKPTFSLRSPGWDGDFASYRDNPGWGPWW